MKAYTNMSTAEKIDAVGSTGVKNMGGHWLGGNEAGANIAVKLGLRLHEKEVQLAIQAGVLAGMLYSKRVVYARPVEEYVGGGGI